MVLNPDVREHLGTPCDIPNPIQQVLDEMTPLFPFKIHSSLIDFQSKESGNLWFIDNLDKNCRGILLNAIYSEQDKQKTD